MTGSTDDQDQLLSVILSRTTVHDFLPEAVDERLLMNALAGACAAPNHRMTEPWGFIRVGPQTRQALVAIASANKASAGGGPLSLKAQEALARKMLNPAELLVVTQTVHSRPDVAREDYAAVACAVQNIQLYLWSHGVGAKWGTGAVTQLPATYQLLGLTPTEREIVGFLWLGVPDGRGAKPLRKRPVADVLQTMP